VIAATLAGLGYGWAFMRDMRIEAAMFVHFAVNATHFLLFVYPRIA
jgi:membrane protease YdiL (CAAX protease family)